MQPETGQEEESVDGSRSPIYDEYSADRHDGAESWLPRALLLRH